jgi:uncharacterized membrane protein
MKHHAFQTVKQASLPSVWSVIWAISLVLIGVGVAANAILGSQASYYVIWWLILLAIGWASWPYAAALLPKGTFLNGYWAAKTLGLVVISLVLWLGGHWAGTPLSRVTGLAALVLVALGGCVILWRKRPRPAWHSERRNTIRSIAVAELGFAALLLLAVVARSLKPDLDSLEKFMNVAFINSILRSEGLPAADPWLAGESINYYYFGHYAYATLTALSGLKTEIAYNLGMATTSALTASLSFTLGQALVHSRLASRKVTALQRRLGESMGAVLTLALILLGGNGHAFFYSEKGPGKGLLRMLESRGVIVGNLDQAYWFPNATRFIGYNPDTADKTIHEFPFYSFLVGDLHAHVINLSFVLLFLLVLLGFLDHQKAHQPSGPGIHRLANCWTQWPWLTAASVLLAVFMMANYWDFVLYWPVAMIAILAANLIPAESGPAVAWLARVGCAVAQGAAVTALAFLLAWPFNATFVPMTSQIAVTESRTPFLQLFVLWGPLILAASLAIAAHPPRWRADPLNPVFPWADWLVLAAGLFALALILAPERVYVVDIYGGEFKRANTMFKLTYQAFVLLAVVWAQGLALSAAQWRPGSGLAWRTAAGLVMAALLVVPAWYAPVATKQWLGHPELMKQQGLDGLGPLSRKNSAQVSGEQAGELADDVAAIQWLNDQVSGQPVILEAAGSSYSDAARISTFTGLPTVLGWETHEWLWRTSSAMPDAYGTLVSPRQADIRTFYTTTDPQERREQIERYQIAYIVVGQLERNAYGPLDELGLDATGTIVFERPTLKIIKTGTSARTAGLD